MSEHNNTQKKTVRLTDQTWQILNENKKSTGVPITRQIDFLVGEKNEN